MKSAHDGQRFEFNIEGRFLGFAAEGHKLKYLRVGLAAEHFRVKLPKHLRFALQSELSLEDPIQVSGVGEFDPAKGTLKLKAHRVALPSSSVPNLEPEAIAPPACCPLETAPAAAPRCKILLCHKSGCQKRGGRQLSQVLENTLRDRKLGDQVSIQYTGCQKRCSSAPSIIFMPGKHLYSKVEPQKIPTLIDKHFGTE